jgi:hypothetical protein
MLHFLMAGLLAPAPLVVPALTATIACPADSTALHTRPPSVVPPDSTATKVRRPRRTDYTVAPGETYHYDRPHLGRTLLNIPRYIGAYPRWAWQKEHRWGIAGVISSTALLLWLDEPIINAAQQMGRWANLTSESGQTTLVAIPFRPGNSTGALDFELNVPTTINGGMYFLGDGWTHLTITGAFYSYGLFGRDNRASQVAAQLTSGIAASGVVVQVLKRSTGRESPYTTDYPGGRWKFFPNQGEYTRHVPFHDAFPSGHLATAMTTVTVIADNYPEYHFIRPLGYGLMGLLGYAMLNNGVHWASDYPLGLAIGYGMGKLAVARNRRRIAAAEAPAIGHRRRPIRPFASPFVAGPFVGARVQWAW